MRQDLLGYLLGSLEPEERQRIEDRLNHDRALHEELALLRGGLDVLDDGPKHFEPPPGLARRTCQFVARVAIEKPAAKGLESAALSSAAIQSAARQAEIRSTPDVVPAVRTWRGRRRNETGEPLAPAGEPWRFVDIAMAAAICLAGAALIFPLINVSRANARVAACANKLRQVGVGLTQYSEQHNGFFPRVEERGDLAVGGIYAPTLLSEGYVTDPRLFVCPSSELADVTSFRIPSLIELHAATGDKLANYRASMGGSFGYALGYREKGAYKPTRNLYRDCFALASDVPAKDGSASPNHGWLGHNVLLEDGHIVYLRSCRIDGSTDNIFVNDDGRVAAGCHVNDAVVVRSDVAP
jgi:anti-sigma-K factor RskA